MSENNNSAVTDALTEDVPVDALRMPDKFSAISRLITRDLNDHRTYYEKPYYKITKGLVADYLKDPYHHEKGLRDAVIYLYGASPHFRRLIQYFVSLSDLNYVVSPYKVDASSANETTVRRNFKRVLSLLGAMDLKNVCEKILTVCFREDVFYGTIRETADSAIIQQLPSDYCQVAVIEDNVLNVSFNFSYFSSREYMLEYYPEEFRLKYERYKREKKNLRWQELDAPNSFAIKCNKDILNYALPPFAGLLREIFDLEDYRNLKKTKLELENYAMLVMQLGATSDGKWQMNYNKAVDFWRNLDSVLPEEVGSVLSPMPIEKISFERTHTGDTDTIAEAEQNLFTAAGVSSLLFNNAKA